MTARPMAAEPGGVPSGRPAEPPSEPPSERPEERPGRPLLKVSSAPPPQGPDPVAGGPPDPSGGASGPRRPRGPRRRLRRWTRRLIAVFLVLLVVGTVFSFVYNAATAGRTRLPAGLEFVQADGIRTRYRHWGAQGPPIVLVHGAAESADTWDAVAPLLAAGHRVFALDLTGWGYSERRGPYDAGHQAAQLLGFLEALRLDRALLVGHSSGAGVIAEAALRAPGRASGLVFLDGDGLDTGAGSGGDRARSLFQDPYRTTLLRLAVRSDWVIRRIYGAQCGPSCARLDRAGVDRWRRPLQVPGAERAIWEMRGVIGLPAGRLAGLAGLGVPKAVVFGARDDVFSRTAPYETAARIGAPPPAIIAGAQHLSLVSHPRQVAGALLAQRH